MKSTFAVLALLSFTVLSFQVKAKDRKSENLPSGKYIGGSEDNPSVVLIINSDHTYEYKNAGTSLQTSGKWEQKGNNVVLLHSKDLKFHDKWQFANGNQCVKSRQGAAFYRLCPKSDCAKVKS